MRLEGAAVQSSNTEKCAKARVPSAEAPRLWPNPNEEEQHVLWFQFNNIDHFWTCFPQNSSCRMCVCLSRLEASCHDGFHYEEIVGPGNGLGSEYSDGLIIYPIYYSRT